MSSEDPVKLAEFAEQRAKAGGYRDALAAVNRAISLNPTDAVRKRLEAVGRQVDVKAAAGAKVFLARMGKEGGRPWIDEFLAYRDEFEFAPGAGEVMKRFNALRAEHEGPAKRLMGEAREAFGAGRREEGMAKYREMLEKYYAASGYRNVKRWVEGGK